MEPISTAMAVQAGAGILNSIGGMVSQGSTNKFNAAQARLAYKRNVKFWNMQNEYNTPSAQMQRFKEAGLNPNLIYGQGNPGNAGPGPSYDPPKYEAANPVPDFTGLSQTYLNAKQLQAGIEQVHAATELTKARTNTEVINQSLKGLGKEKLAIDINRLQALLPYQVEVEKNRASSSAYDVQEKVSRLMSMSVQRQSEYLNQEYTRKKMTQADIDADIKRADLVYARYNNELRKMGFTEKDNYVIRALGQAFDNAHPGDTLHSAGNWAQRFIAWLGSTAAPNRNLNGYKTSNLNNK